MHSSKRDSRPGSPLIPVLSAKAHPPRSDSGRLSVFAGSEVSGPSRAGLLISGSEVRVLHGSPAQNPGAASRPTYENRPIDRPLDGPLTASRRLGGFSARGRGPYQKPYTHYITFAASGCWLWTGAKDPEGYGRYRIGKKIGGTGATIGAHRFVFERFRGPIPSGLCIDHLCRVTSCVNPDHLEAVTHRVNILRGVGASAQNIRKTACKRGHPLAALGAASKQGSRGHRHCPECHRQRQRRTLERRKNGTTDPRYRRSAA